MVLREVTMNPLLFCLRNDHEWTVCFMYFLCLSRLYYKLTIYFANLPRIHYLFNEFTRHLLYVSWIHYFFAYISWLHYHFVNSLWIYYLFREFTIYLANPSWINFEFGEYTMQSSFSRIYNKFTVFMKNLVRIHPQFSRNHHEFTIFFCKSTMNSLSLSLWINVMLRE